MTALHLELCDVAGGAGTRAYSQPAAPRQAYARESDMGSHSEARVSRVQHTGLASSARRDRLRRVNQLRRWLDRGHDYAGPVQVSRFTAVYPCRRCGARFPTFTRCPEEGR